MDQKSTSRHDLLAEFLADRDVRCPRCGYNLRGLRAVNCPECGSVLQLVVSSNPGLWLDSRWVDRASHPLAIAAVAWLGILLFFGPSMAALPLFLWAGAFAVIRYGRWARQSAGAPGVAPVEWRHRALVVAVVFFVLVLAMLALEGY